MNEVLVVKGEAKKDLSFPKKMPWDERAKRIKEMFPSTAQTDFKEIFRIDPMTIAKVYHDCMKMEAGSTGRPGKRPAVNPKDAEQYLRQYQNDDYSVFVFQEAFRILKGDRSFRAMAHKCNLTLGHVQRLLDGRSTPTVEVMEKVARAYKKHPSYFMEYRIAYILGVLSYRMEQYPEASIVPYTNIRGSTEKKWN